jgi:hypothetical protein
LSLRKTEIACFSRAELIALILGDYYEKVDLYAS